MQKYKKNFQIVHFSALFVYIFKNIFRFSCAALFLCPFPDLLRKTPALKKQARHAPKRVRETGCFRKKKKPSCPPCGSEASA